MFFVQAYSGAKTFFIVQSYILWMQWGDLTRMYVMESTVCVKIIHYSNFSLLATEVIQ